MPSEPEWCFECDRDNPDAAEAFAGYLDELERLCNAATPVPWEYADDAGAVLFGEGHQGGIVCEFPDVAADATERDALFIAAARHALPKLIAKVRELQSRVENADALREYADKRGVILTERAISRVCAGCNTKRAGTHCCDCNHELWENEEGVFLGS